MAPVTPACGAPEPGLQALPWATRDARRITVRPLNAAEHEPFAEFVRRLSARSRAHRFHVAVRELSAQAARRLVLLDPCREAAWVAVEHDPPCGIVGEARYAIAESGAAEIALAVADDWQRRGLGSFLLRRLLDHAASTGIHFAWGHVRRDNGAALAMARRFCFDVVSDPGDPTLLTVERFVRRAPAHADTGRGRTASRQAPGHRGITP